jgi:hypothetical protein
MKRCRMREPSDDRPEPLPGEENAIPWPVPLPPGCSTLSFYGSGDQITQAFTLRRDAALRILAEAAPLTLWVRRPNGTVLSDIASLPEGGPGLMAIPEGGTYTLAVQTPARWAVTVVIAE